MFLKSIHKYCKTEKKRIVYFRLCESYRDEYGTARQRMVISLGRLDEIPDIDEKILLVDRINEKLKGSPTLFKSNINNTVEQLAHHFYEQIITKKKIDIGVSSSDDEIVSVKLNSLKNKDVREIGAESISYQAFKQLGIEKYLLNRNWNAQQISLAATHIVSRAVYPASELKTVSWIKENSGICELTGYDSQKLTKDKLYGISKKLYQEKDGLENYLSRCTNDLFNLHDKVILYDLTNTYFEGSMKKYKALDENLPVKIVDKKGQIIELKQVKVENDGDNYLWVKSHAKAGKEQGMCDQFSGRFEEGLRAIRNGVAKKGGTKKLDKVWERIGRLKEKYSSVHKHYEIQIEDNGNGLATNLSFKIKSQTPTSVNAGVYFLRTSLDWMDQKAIWMIYNSIREIEYTFRVLKTDLDLRPIFHKTDEASMAHLHLGLLAYWLVSTIRYQLKQNGYNHDWREIVRTMNSQKIVTTTFTNEKDDVISIRQCSEPSVKARTIYEKLNYK